MKLFKKIVCIFVVLMMFSVITVVAQVRVIRTKPPVLTPTISVELKATAKYYTGVCPITIKMTGTIRVKKAMTVNYYFKRSDGFPSPSRLTLTSLIFTGAGYKNIPFSWELSKDYKGWVQLVVKTSSGEIKSGQVVFTVKCDKTNQIKPQISLAPVSSAKKPPSIYKTQTSRRTPVVTGFEKDKKRTLNLINAELREASLIFNQMMILLKASQEDKETMEAAQDAFVDLRASAKKTEIQMRKKKLGASRRSSVRIRLINQKGELNNLNNILTSLRKFNRTLNQLKNKSGILQKKKDEYKKMLLNIKYMLRKK